VAKKRGPTERKQHTPEELAGQLTDQKPIREGGRYLTNTERMEFVERTPDLYQRWIRSLLPMQKFIKENRELIDQAIRQEEAERNGER